MARKRNMAKKTSLWNSQIVAQALLDSLRKLNPRWMIKNPVMFVVEVGSVLTSALLIDNTIDQATATARLKAMFGNEDEALWPGSFVNARVRLDTRSNAVVIPAAAVQRGPQGLFTWVIVDGNVAQPRTIQVGATSGNLTIITSGLAEGERVVTDGQYKLQTNAPVSITSSQVAASGDAP